MLKLIIFLTVFITSFSSEMISMNNLKTTAKDGLLFATMKSLNNSGLNIKQNDKAIIITNEFGQVKLQDSKIITSKMTYSFVSTPFADDGNLYLPLDLILALNGYSLESGKISKFELPKSPKVLPKKIISLSPGISEKIYALGAGNLLVGRTEFCIYPKEVQKVDVIGNLFELNLELILIKKPDLFIAEPEFKESTKTKLEGLGINVFKLKSLGALDEIYGNTLNIGAAIGYQQEALALVASLKDKVLFTKNLLKDQPIPTVYFVVGTGNSEFTPGKDTLIDALITIAGGKNIASENIGWKYSLENLIINDPKIIFGSKENINTMNTNKNYALLSAIKNKNTATVDDVGIFQIPGPRSLTEGVYEMIKIFHPELAGEYKDKVLK